MSFYYKIAFGGIKKNKQLYYPYMLAGSVMVMIFYIFSYLNYSEVVANLPGKDMLPVLFNVGSKVIALFSVPFLFYTNSALIKKRQKELGLYNILGMNKKNIFYVLLFETAITYLIVVVSGIIFGIAFSKVAELGLVNIMNKEVNFNFYIDWKSFGETFIVFAFIYFLILLNQMRLIHKNDPIKLLNSDTEGEKPPKSNGFLSVLSLVALIVSYIIIGRMTFPVNKVSAAIALILFFIGTFGVFICLSVSICKLLQKNKNFYYKTSHFIGTSSMSYRMKRNGASLAIICILATLILSTLAFSFSFYKGSIDVIKEHYPYDIGVSIKIPSEDIEGEMLDGESTKDINSEITKASYGKDVKRNEFYTGNMLAVIENGILDLNYNMKDTWFVPGFYDGWERDNKKIVYVHLMSVEDYNALNKTHEKLSKNEVIMASDTVKYEKKTIVNGNVEYEIKKVSKNVPKMSEVRIDGASLHTHGCEQVYIIVPGTVYDFIGGKTGVLTHEERNYLSYNWESDINVNGTDEDREAIYNSIDSYLNALKLDHSEDINHYLKIERMENFFAFAGGLLFLAIIINILFIVVTTIIMYYKQISEGYEDQKNFEIMKKLGITEKEIKKSVNFQMLFVFILPIAIAGIHFIFTSNLVYLLLKYAVLDDRLLLTGVMKVCYLIFLIVYFIVYAVTSRKYLKIINRKVN